MDPRSGLTLRFQVDGGGHNNQGGGRFPDNGGLVKGAINEQDTGKRGVQLRTGDFK